MYADVRKMREDDSVNEEKIATIFEKVWTDFSTDWLLPLELYELSQQHDFSCQTKILQHLKKLQGNKKHQKLIESGLNLLSKT